MAKNVKLAGAIFPDVPSVRLPDENDVFHNFTDVTDTTATATDVAQGKLFFDALGILTEGTASGGGGDDSFAKLVDGSIVTANIPAGITRVYQYAFRSCTKLETVNVPEGVTSIGNNAFNGCTALKDVDLPSTLTSIGTNGFNNCSSLRTLTVRAVSPPTLSSSGLPTALSAIIYVPAESVEAYKADSNWGRYAAKITPMP